MKIKKVNIILIIIILLSICTSVAVIASLDNTLSVPESTEDTDGNPYRSVRDGAPENRIYITDDGEKITLAYTETMKTPTSIEYDIYVDSDGNEYSYDYDGNLIDIMYSPRVTEPPVSSPDVGILSNDAESDDGTVTLDDAVEIAREHAENLYGDKLDGMSLYSATHPENNSNYFIAFAKTYGKDGFICGEKCSVMVKLDGSVFSCSIPNVYELEELDKSILADITEAEVIKYVNEIAEGLFSDLKDLQVRHIILDKVDDGYAIKIDAVLTTEVFPSEDMIIEYDLAQIKGPGSSFCMTFYYPLEP